MATPFDEPERWMAHAFQYAPRIVARELQHFSGPERVDEILIPQRIHDEQVIQTDFRALGVQPCNDTRQRPVYRLVEHPEGDSTPVR